MRRKHKLRRIVKQVGLMGAGILVLSTIGTSVIYAAGVMNINYTGILPNGLKTTAKGTIRSIDDISNGNLKVKLTTKSEDDPKKLNDYVVKGALQVNANSSFKLLSGKPVESAQNNYRFDPKDKNSPMPSVLITNIGETKAGQKIDAVWTMTSFNKPDGESKYSQEKTMDVVDEDVQAEANKMRNVKDTESKTLGKLAEQQGLAGTQTKQTDTESAERHDETNDDDKAKEDSSKAAKNQVESQSIKTDKSEQTKADSKTSEAETKAVNNSYVRMSVGQGGALSVNMREMGGVDYTVKFYKAGTRTPLNLLMYPVVNDIDYSQVFGIKNATLLGHGSNITSPDGNTLVSDSSGTDGLVDFPNGGGVYQSFGSELNVHYNSKGLNGVNIGVNGFDLLGSYGSVKNIEVSKPDFGPVKIPKAKWEIDEKDFKPGKEVKASFVQPINHLDKDINHRYKNWETTLTVPQAIKQAKIKMVDAQGNAIPTTQKDLGNQRYQLSVSSETMKKLRFAGETYHFEITGQLDDQLVDQTVLAFKADTNIDGIKDTIQYKTKPIEHKSSVKLHFKFKGTNQEIAKAKEIKVGYGKPWQVKLKELKGYTLDKQNSAKLSGDKVNFKNKEITLFYEPKAQKLQVNYLTEDGKSLGKNDVKTKYHEIYGTSSKDIDDVYSLITEKLPKNAAGFINDRDEKVNYYYRKTRGYWVELNYGAQAITRVDYHGNIRSNGIEYNDGEIITLVNTENGVDVQHDRKGQGALTDKPLGIGQSTTFRAANGDIIKITVNSSQQAMIYRDSFGYKMKTDINQGNITNTTGVYNGGETLAQEYIDVVNGVTGTKISRQIKDYSQDGYTATSEAVTKGKGQRNTSAVNTAGTSFKRSAKVVSATPKVAQFSMPVNDEVADDDEIALEITDPKLEYTDELKGSADQVGEKSNQFGAGPTGDIVDDQRANQNLTGKQEVKVYKGKQLVKQGQIKNGEKLKIEAIEDVPDKQGNKQDSQSAEKRKSNPAKQAGKSTVEHHPNKQPKPQGEPKHNSNAKAGSASDNANPKPTMPTDAKGNSAEKGSNFEKRSGFLPKMGWNRATWLTVLGSVILSFLAVFVISRFVWKKYKDHGGKGNA
ncbi:hypothetical protein JOC36_000156 [Weissella uvarum]|uniref:MucBP domain-containing protein n=1 Tax=Weissella uvarum TaxID=1479233 RepID=UPI001960F57E|nr:MucBP domain-containing protein [Weissella uvarum]MBM7616623.1 hypothetical protein [Weissella uvarum]MCM0594919.1 MucBP domain-containing protein [Weissella uvarum]